VTDEVSDGPPRALLLAAIAVAVAALIVILGIAAVRQGPAEQRPVAISAVPAPRAESTECRSLTAALPAQLGDYHRAATADPTPAGAAAWQRDDDIEAVILRCGLDRPDDFVVGTAVQQVDAVQWYRVGEAGVGNERVGEAGAGQERVGEGDSGRTTWFAVDRPVYVAVTLPAGSGATPIQQLSKVISDTLSATPVKPGPPR
jgi:hypothetical protein